MCEPFSHDVFIKARIEQEWHELISNFPNDIQDTKGVIELKSQQ